MAFPLRFTILLSTAEDRSDEWTSRQNALASSSSESSESVAPDVDAQHVVARLREGDAQIVSELFDTYYLRLVAFTTSMVHDDAAAEDIVQEMLSSLWQRRATIDIQRTLSGYLFGAVRHLALNYRRAETTRTARTTEAVDGTATTPPADLAVEQIEREQMVRDAVMTLAPHYRELLILRAAGLKYEEIAHALGIPLKTARTRGLRGMAQLAERLAGRL